jgi:hypothetical protein
MIFSLKIKLFFCWKFRTCFWCFWKRSWWAEFNGIYLVNKLFGFKMWELLIFKWFLPLKIQIRFWKEKSVQDVVTLECLLFNSTRRNCDVPLVLLERSCNGIEDMVTLGPIAQATLVYSWRKFVCLSSFVYTYEIHWTKMLQIVFLVSLEIFQGGEVHWLGFMAFGLAV